MEEDGEEGDRQRQGDDHVGDPRLAEGAGDGLRRPLGEGRDRLVADDHQCEAAVEGERADRDRERRESDVGRHDRVEQAARHADQQAQGDHRPQARPRLDEDPHHGADQAGRRGDGQVDVGVDHDQGHRQGHEECGRHVEREEREGARLSESGDQDQGGHDHQGQDQRHLGVPGGGDAPQGARRPPSRALRRGVRCPAHADAPPSLRRDSRRRTVETRSMTMATRMRAPTTALCQNLSTPIAVSADVIVLSSRAPMAAP